MNNPSHSPTNTGPRRVWRLLALVALLILSVWIARRSIHELANTSKPVPEPVSVARKQLENRDGRWFSVEPKMPFTGWMTDHFADGTLSLKTFVRDGLLEGESEGWFTNGVREVREEFRNGLPHGLRTTWHPNGQKRSEGRLAAGLQEGPYLQWHEDGSLAVEAEFAAGKAQGLSRAWYPSGCLQAEALMKHGEVQTRHFYPDGARREPTLHAEHSNFTGIASSK